MEPSKALAECAAADTPRTVLEALLHSGDVAVREAAALHVTLAGETSSPTEAEVLARMASVLAEHHDAKVRWTARIHPSFGAPLELHDLTKGDEPMLAEVIEHSTSVEKLRELARHESAVVRTGVAANRETPVDVLLVLAGDASWNVRNMALVRRLSRCALSDDEFRTLARLPNVEARSWCAASSPKIPVELLVELTRDPDPGVRRYAACNPRTPDEAVLASGEMLTLKEASRHGGPKVLEKFLAPLRDDHAAIATHFKALRKLENLPAWLLTYFARSPEWPVQGAAAKHPRLSPELLTELAISGGHELVRASVAKNPNTPAEVLARLFDDPDEGVRANVSQHPSCPVEILDRATDDPSERVKTGVLYHQRATSEMRGRLGEDERLAVAVSLHKDCPLHLLDRWARGDNPLLRQATARHPSTPAEALEHLASTATDLLWKCLALNPALSPELRARVEAAGGVVPPEPVFVGLTPAQRLAQLARSNDPFARVTALLNPDVPPEAFSRAARSTLWFERWAAARHPRLPADDRERLRSDGNRYVRAAAR